MEKAFTPRIRSFLNNYEKPCYVKESQEPSKIIVDCALGVNPFGCSPSVAAFLKSGDTALLDAFSHYPAYPYTSLRQAVSRYWMGTAAIGIDEIRVGLGSMAMIDMLCKCLVDPGSRVLGFVPQFPDFSATVMSFGGVYETFPLDASRDYRLDVDGFCGAITGEHRLVYMDNPNNPTGQVFPLEAIAKVAARCRENGAVLMVDEAYADYIDKSETAVALFPEFENLCVLRTFSKGFGLAGLRVGYAFLHEPLASCYDRVSYIFSVSTHGAALAEQALLDEGFIKKSRESVSRIKGELLSLLTRLRVAHTHPEVPIFTLLAASGLADDGVSLHSLLEKHGVKSEAGEDFENLGKHAVRLRVPKETEPLLSILRDVERELR